MKAMLPRSRKAPLGRMEAKEEDSTRKPVKLMRLDILCIFEDLVHINLNICCVRFFGFLN